MPTINQLPLLLQVSPGDQFAVYTPNNGDARRLPVSSLLTFFQQTFASPTLAVNLFVPGNGFNIPVPTPAAQQQWMLLQPAGPLASGTVTLPLNTLTPDGTEILISSTQNITAFTLGFNGASAIYGNALTLNAGGAIRYRFYQPTNSWYNIISDSDLVGPASSTDNAIARFDSTTGKFLQNSLVTIADDGAIVAPDVGSIIPFYFADQAAFPSAATYHGAIAHSHADGAMYFAHAGNWIALIHSGGPLGTPISGNISACTSTSMVMVTPVIGAATGTSLSTTGNQVITGTGKQGYDTGSGGVVTQITDKSTAVTLDKTNGSITMDADSLAAATTVSFTLTNSTIEAGDILVMNHISGGTAGSYTLNAQSAAGSASINVRNVTAGALAEAIVIRFAVIKAVSA